MTHLTKITILLGLISLFYIAATTPPTPATNKSPHWFREKYLKEIYNQYYVYAFETDYKDRVNCPDIHKLATLSAITGITQYKHHNPQRVIPHVAVSVGVTEPAPVPLFQLPKPNFSYILDITVRDIVIFIMDIVIFIAGITVYTWQVLIMSVFLALTLSVTILVLVLFFAQY